MKCYQHADADAAGMCSVCGRPVCGDCCGPPGAQPVCPECGTPASRSCTVAQADAVPPRRSKSLAAALVLSFFPGLGHLYLGEILRAVVIIVSFSLLAGSAGESATIPLLLTALWFFQMFDALRLARQTQVPARDAAPGLEPSGRETLFWAWFLIVSGLLFQLHTLNVLPIALLPKLLPLVLIFLGLKLIAGGRGRRISAGGNAP